MMYWTKVRIVAGTALLMLVALGLSIAVAQVTNSGKPTATADRPALDGSNGSAVPATLPATVPTTPPAVAESPKQVVLAAYRSGLAGDEKGMIERFADLTPEQTETLKQVVHVLSAVQELQKAVSAKFGPEVGQQFAAMGFGVGASDVEEATETITGDRAVVDMGQAGPGTVPLVRVGQTWKISLEVLKTLNTDAVAGWEQKVPEIQKMSADIAAGKYKTPQEVQRAVRVLRR